jgi:ATP phosphoribosyltransferase regulatory subunit
VPVPRGKKAEAAKPRPPELRLPAGMRDHAPAAAAARLNAIDTLIRAFQRAGFERVLTPAFEYEEVLALGLGAAARAATVRFVEPSSGQIVALRPDITPQIARLIATRYRDVKGPVRLCYEGTVVRLDKAARGQRELSQAGVELAGLAGPDGDAEVIALGVQALTAAGLSRITVDLGHLGLARDLLTDMDLPPGAQDQVRRLMAKRDRQGLESALSGLKVAPAVKKCALEMLQLSGSPSVLKDARQRLPRRAQAAVEELLDIVAAVSKRGLQADLHVDLGEVRGFDYYTGVRFQAFVRGAPDAVLRGGRYDDLLGRYGRPSPAVGFAIDVEAVAGALDASSSAPLKNKGRN